MGKLFNKLQLDLLKRHLGPFLFCFFTMMFLLLLQFLILHIDKLIGKDIPISVIIELILTNLAYMVVLAAPMAVLIATLMAFGKFSELNELTAIRASGVNPIRLMAPVFIAATLLFIGLAWFSNSVLPEANHKARSLFIDIRLKKPGFDLKPNSFYDGIEDYTFLVNHIDNKTDSLYDVVLFQEPTDNRERAYITAKKGKLVSEGSNGLTLFLIDGIMHKTMPSNSNADVNIERTRFQKHRITFDIGDLSFERSDPDRRNRSDRTMNIQSMQVIVDSLQKEINQQYLKSAEMNYTLPKIKASDIAQQRDFRILLIDDIDSVKQAPLTSDLIVLNTINTLDEQIEVLGRTVTDLQNYRATFQSSNANIVWRLKSVSKYTVEIYKKFSIPFSCIIFVLLGAPIGILTKKGNFGVAAIISSVILTIYWISLIQGEKLADRLFVSPFIGMWAFNIIMGIVGLVMLLQLTSEFQINRLFHRRV
ncbi:MAG: LptF/LptG family permease [Balneolaceae bacterium]